jgi:hypothetical protein
MRLCAGLGEMHYRKAALESQILHAMNQIGQLEQEFRGLKAAQESAAATTTDAPATATAAQE